MAFKYINAAISGEYQRILARLIEDPETLDLADTPTYNLPASVPQTGDNADGYLTGSLKSIEMDGTDDFMKLNTSQGLGTEILLEDIGENTVKHGATANNIALESWVKLDASITSIDTNSEFFEVTIQRNSVSSTTGFDGNYMARTIYATTATTSAHFIDFQFATGGSFAYSLTSNKSLSLNEWHHVWCEYTVSGADQNPRFTPTPRGWMRIYLNGALDRQQTLDDLSSPGVANSTLPFPATGSAVTYGYDRPISFDGKLDEMRVWLNTGTPNSISTLASKGNIGLKPDEFESQAHAVQVKTDFAPSAEYLASWWRFESISAVDLFASVADSIPDVTAYGHSATPQNFVGTLDFSEELTVVAGAVVSGLSNSVTGQVDLDKARGGVYDHGGMCIIHDGQDRIKVEQNVDSLVACASNSWSSSGGAAVNYDVLNIFFGSSAYTINTTEANQGAIHTIDYSHLFFNENEYTMSLRLLLTSGSTSARATFTLGDRTTAMAVTGVMDRNVWMPIVIRNTARLPAGETTITGEVGLQSLGDADNTQGALFRVDALEIREGFYAGNFVGPQQIRKGGEISWNLSD